MISNGEKMTMRDRWRIVHDDRSCVISIGVKIGLCWVKSVMEEKEDKDC